MTKNNTCKINKNKKNNNKSTTFKRDLIENIVEISKKNSSLNPEAKLFTPKNQYTEHIAIQVAEYIFK